MVGTLLIPSPNPMSPPPPPPPKPSLGRRLLLGLTWIFNDSTMGVFGILALACAVWPNWFRMSDQAQNILDRIEWVVVAAFAIDYVIHLLLATNRKRYVTGYWQMLDLFTILVPALTLIPWVDDSLRHTAALRLLNILRAFSFGARAAVPVVLVDPEEERKRTANIQPVAAVVQRGEGFPQKALEWTEFLDQTKNRDEQWFDVFNLSDDRIGEMSKATGVPRMLVESALGTNNYPRIESFGQTHVVTMWLPIVQIKEHLEIERIGVLLAVLDGKSLLTASPRDCRLREHMSRRLNRERRSEDAFLVQATRAFLGIVLEQNEDAAAYIERYLRAMEEIPVARAGQDFFKLAFRMRKDLSQIRADLWRVSGMLSAISEGRSVLPWSQTNEREAFRSLDDQAEYLYETVNILRDGLISLIELHMNTVSFEMNRVMKVLAVVSVLGLVPATVGGLLGMNILGSPWPFTLGQVTFGVAFAILTLLYLFLTRGWLK